MLSSCVICLVIAREIFLLKSDCSAITKVHKLNFSLLSLTYFAKDKQTLKMEDTLYKMDIFRHRPICGLFPLKCQSLRQTFQRIIQALLLAKHLRRFCCWFEWSWNEAKKQSNKPMSGAGSASCRPGSVQLNLWKNMKRQTDPYGVLTRLLYIMLAFFRAF